MKKTVICLALVSLLASPAVPQAAVLESPAKGAALSGIGFISGWKCDASNITVTIDEGEHLSVAMHQDRADLLIEKTCGDTIRHGFIRQINWGYVGDGEHVVVAYDNRVEFDRAMFTVGSTGEEFLKEVRRRSIIENFPTIGEDTLVEWNESTQHFEILTVFESPVRAVYDEEWWRQYNEDIVTGTYKSKEFLYVEEPDVEACEPGELAVGAKNRALEAANQIRGLHGLSAVRYSSRYDQQVQEAALIQAANRFINHRPSPSVKCYSAAGAEGSRTSNLWRVRWSDGLGVDSDPARYMVSWTNDSKSISLVAGAGHRRWMLNPFAVQFAYGQVEGYAAHKVFGFDDGPGHAPRIEVDFVAFPFEVYPFNLVLGDPPWSFSVIEDKENRSSNRHDYFRHATITVIRTEDEAELAITDRYTDSEGVGIPNFLSWQVEGWDYDTLYEVEIGNVAMQSGETRSFSYPVLIDRESIDAERAWRTDTP